MITTCTHCGKGYDDPSEENANAPERYCHPCWSMKTKSESYIASIRNPDKKQYAGLWLQFLKGQTYKPDASKFNLSYMAAQAVRLRLEKLNGL